MKVRDINDIGSTEEEQAIISKRIDDEDYLTCSCGSKEFHVLTSDLAGMLKIDGFKCVYCEIGIIGKLPA